MTFDDGAAKSSFASIMKYIISTVSIKDTIIIKLNNALSTLIVVDVDCEYSACKSQYKPL